MIQPKPLVREACELKIVPKSGKSPPPLPQDVLDFFEFGKNWKFDDPPPSDLIWEKLKLGKLRILGPPPHRKKIISLKHLKLPKNHFKTNLFFVQLKHLRCTFKFGEKMKI